MFNLKTLKVQKYNSIVKKKIKDNKKKTNKEFRYPLYMYNG